MVIDQLVRNPGSWLAMGRDDAAGGVVISSRVRLARNLRDAAFPGWAGQDESVRICARLRKAVESLPELVNPVTFDMGSIDPIDREILRERHLISNELADKGVGSALVLSEDERIAVMINEEDHLRLQAMSPNLDIQTVWEKLNRVDADLESRLDYAFSPRLGYLTACPTNVGTGLRASVMLHLSGLRLAGEIDSVINGLEKIGLTVRGLLGEGSEAHGNLFQVSNQTTLGETEEAIIKRFTSVIADLTRHEENARARLMEDRRAYVLDQCGRAFGILRYAKVLSSTEAVDLLSGLRLGIELGLVEHLAVAQINELLLMTQPGHMQKLTGRVLEPNERDEMRAVIVRKKLRGVAIAG